MFFQQKGSRSKTGKRSGLPNRVVYTAEKRTTTYNEFIPENERSRQSAFVTLREALHKKISFFSGKRTENRTTRAERHRHSASALHFAPDRFYLFILILCALIVGLSFIIIPTAFAKETVTVHINDGGRTFDAQTAAQTVGELLEYNNIVIGENDYLETSADTAITEDMEIIIRRAMDLTIRTGADIKKVSMIAGTVGDALEEAGIVLEDADEIYPDKNTYVRSDMTIDYIQVKVEYATETQPIGYQEVTVEDSSLAKGTQEVRQWGEPGSKEIKTKLVYKNGALYSQEVVEETIVAEAQNEIIAIGTKEEEKKPSSGSGSSSSSKPSSGSSSSGKPSSGSSITAPSGGPSVDQIAEVYTLRATAYWEDGSSTTASGTYPQVGTIAANPNFLPYGTRLWIEGYGYGSVEDTGGFISQHPYGIDLFMSSEAACASWGVRNVTVYVLK